MKNVVTKITPENKLVIEIDLNKEFGPSASGKTIIIASTEGNQKMDDNGKKSFAIGLNVYRPK
jgi:hypothetical protein